MMRSAEIVAMRCASYAMVIAMLEGGCARRTVYVSSEPAGASVTVNDVQIGRTPCEFDFTFHGVYDVVFEKTGYEPLRKAMRADAPVYEYPPADLLALAWPGSVHAEHRWHVTLVPSKESLISSDEQRAGFEAALLERARGARESARTSGTR